MRNLMIARPTSTVVTRDAAVEPEPRHHRPTDTPSSPVPRPARGGTIDDIRRGDDNSGNDGGFETVDRFHELVRHLVADGDQRAARAGRRAPRLLSEMEDRLTPHMVDCTHCKGRGGSTTTTKSGGVTRSSWKRCGSCNGRGSSSCAST
ncbi:hypothetical protein ACFQ7N_10210 [Streptomyces niveus]|uniref:hypothetical protein n=1 Tax=Streptomyces niveus TaxID=193462 RepID=UPI0036C80EA2